MCTILNRHRISRGWGAMAPEDAEVAANVWIDELDKASVPVDAYDQLYHRASDARASAISRGEHPPDFTADLMVGLWRGANGLAAEMAGSSEAKTIACPTCDGRGWVEAEVDGYKGIKTCRH